MNKATTVLGKEREAKLKGCKILAKLNLPHIRKADYKIVANQVGINWQQLYNSYKNWILYGLVDLRNKHKQQDAAPVSAGIAKFRNANPRYHADYIKQISKSTAVESDYRIKKAIREYIGGASLKEIYSITGIGVKTLYKSIEKMEKTGRIGRYKIYTPMKDAPQLRVVLAVKYAKLLNSGKSPSESKIFKEMSVVDRLRYVQFYATIKEAINKK